MVATSILRRSRTWMFRLFVLFFLFTVLCCLCVIVRFGVVWCVCMWCLTLECIEGFVHVLSSFFFFLSVCCCWVLCECCIFMCLCIAWCWCRCILRVSSVLVLCYSWLIPKGVWYSCYIRGIFCLWSWVALYVHASVSSVKRAQRPANFPATSPQRVSG